MNKQYKTITSCRACSSSKLVPILDLGEQPLANSLKKSPEAAEDNFPLRTAFCRQCSLFQLTETVDKEELFHHYVWVTGTSKGARDYSKLFFERAVRSSGIKSDGFVLEIASNDGTFLRPFLEGGYKVLGVDPAENIAQMAQEAGVETLPEFWGSKAAEKIESEYGKPDLVFARNVIPHVSELHDVIGSMANVLSAGGVGIIEFHYAGIILEELHYDSIYHEHLCYFTIRSMENLLNRYGLYGFHIDYSPISGGSYVIHFSKVQRKKTDDYLSYAVQEEEKGYNELSSWENFAEQSRNHRRDSEEILAGLAGRRIVGFGSSARSSTYLNFCRINRSDIEAIIDNNPLKQGLCAAGSSIPIVSMEEGLALRPDVVFILAWNFKDEIIGECKLKGFEGDYIIPFPEKPYLVEKACEV